MTLKKNLTGKKFGSLTVIQEAGSNKDGRALWLCRCICGEERTALGKDLGKKVTRCTKKCVLTDDLKGQRIGNLLVLGQEGSDKHGFRQFRCRCLTTLNSLVDDRLPHEKEGVLGNCNKEILINAVGLTQEIKASRKRTIPKSCYRCSRILAGKFRRETCPIEDLTGRKFGRLTAIKKILRISGIEHLTKRIMYECSCSCGSGLITYVRHEALIGASVRPIRSCGCLQREYAKNNKPSITHGLSDHPLYGVRQNMIKRCYNNDCNAFARYGGRGIEVCDAWLQNYIVFHTWAIDNGWSPGLTIDRINNNGPYSPENCRFITRAANALKMQLEHDNGFLIAGLQINVNELSQNSQVSAQLCKKLLLNGYTDKDVYTYGRLQLHQKVAVSKSIHRKQPISMVEALTHERITSMKSPQSSEMGSYRSMMARCYNQKTPSYRYYGAKGIQVCTAWKGNPSQFLLDMGPKPEPKMKFALDRIDPKQDYAPENCRWLTISDNSRRVKRKK